VANRNLLLLSNSTNAGQSWLEHANDEICDFLTSEIQSVLFIPYAGVTISWDEYTRRAREKFREFGYALLSVHEVDDIPKAVKQAEAIVVGGGNTFHLVWYFHQTGLIELIRERVLNEGIPYIGWSAGSNVACPTMKTTNDMPIVEPASFDTLNLIPFQINPHYLDANPQGHQGETREERILEFIAVNREVSVVGLREGTLFRIHGDEIQLIGPKSARIFHHKSEPYELSATDSFTFLLTSTAE